MEDFKKYIKPSEEKEEAIKTDNMDTDFLSAEDKERIKQDSQNSAIANIASDTNRTLQVKLNERLALHINSDQKVAEKIEKTADKLVESGLKVQENKVETEVTQTETEKNKAEFELSEHSYRAFGQATAPKDRWKKKLIAFGTDVWFVVLFIISFFTIAPTYFTVHGIKTQSGVLKFVAISVAVVIAIGILGLLCYGIGRWVGAW